jgi:hypothetical protein
LAPHPATSPRSSLLTRSVLSEACDADTLRRVTSFSVAGARRRSAGHARALVYRRRRLGLGMKQG